MNEDGQYVLQDPEKGIYVVDHSKHVLLLNGMPQTEEEEQTGMTKLEQLVTYSNDFVSDTPDFAVHDGMVSRLKEIDVTGLEQGYNYNFYIYKYNTNDLIAELAETEEPDLSSIMNRIGEVYCESEGDFDEDGDLIFTFGDSALFSMHTRADGVQDELTTGYMYFLTVEGYPYVYNYYQVRHDDYVLPITEDINICIVNELVKCQPAIDIHLGLQRVNEMYRDAFGMAGYDNNETPVVALVNATDAEAGLPLNAVAIGTAPDGSCGMMEFGLGAISFDDNGVSGSSYLPLTEIDIMGHEFTHLAAEKLVYQNESGALDESYADIMGKKLERYVLNSEAGFTIGEDFIHYVGWELGTLLSMKTPITAMRNFENPYATSNPGCYNGLNWLDYTQTGEDAGGVHTNSTVQSYMFYLLCTGGTLTPECTSTGMEPEEVTVEAIDRDNAELIMFASLVYFGLKNLDYDAARRNSLHVAQLYFGEDSQEYNSLLRAWYAVGVGDWSPSTSDISAVDFTSHKLQTTMTILGNRIIITRGTKQYDVTGREI